MMILMLILSLIALIWSADQLVTGASGLSLYFRIPPFLTGLLIVALSTSLPELLLGLISTMEGREELAMGNAIGSNIANIGLVLGLTALIKPIQTNSTILRREFLALFLFMLYAYSLILDGSVGLLDGCLFLIACIIIISYFVLIHQFKQPLPQFSMHFKQSYYGRSFLYGYIINIISAMVVMTLSTRFLIESAMHIGQFFHLSELFIGLTIVALCTSLPELATSIIATLKGADDIALGNILGSNLFNLASVILFPGLIHPTGLGHALLTRDLPMILGLTLLLYWMSSQKRKRISRLEGAVLLFIYIGYIAVLIINAV